MRTNAPHAETARKSVLKEVTFGQLILLHMYQTWIIVMFVHYVP